MHTICICNSMGSSEIWDKYHECCIGNGINFTRRSEITHFQYNKSGIYPKFSLLYPCYSMLISYSWLLLVFPCTRYINCATKVYVSLIGATLWHKFYPIKLWLQLFHWYQWNTGLITLMLRDFCMGGETGMVLVCTYINTYTA